MSENKKNKLFGFLPNPFAPSAEKSQKDIDDIREEEGTQMLQTLEGDFEEVFDTQEHIHGNVDDLLHIENPWGDAEDDSDEGRVEDPWSSETETEEFPGSYRPPETVKDRLKKYMEMKPYNLCYAVMERVPAPTEIRNLIASDKCSTEEILQLLQYCTDCGYSKKGIGEEERDVYFDKLYSEMKEGILKLLEKPTDRIRIDRAIAIQKKFKPPKVDLNTIVGICDSHYFEDDPEEIRELITIFEISNAALVNSLTSGPTGMTVLSILHDRGVSNNSDLMKSAAGRTIRGEAARFSWENALKARTEYDVDDATFEKEAGEGLALGALISDNIEWDVLEEGKKELGIHIDNTNKVIAQEAMNALEIRLNKLFSLNETQGWREEASKIIEYFEVNRRDNQIWPRVEYRMGNLIGKALKEGEMEQVDAARFADLIEVFHITSTERDALAQNAALSFCERPEEVSKTIAALNKHNFISEEGIQELLVSVLRKQMSSKKSWYGDSNVTEFMKRFNFWKERPDYSKLREEALNYCMKLLESGHAHELQDVQDTFEISTEQLKEDVEFPVVVMGGIDVALSMQQFWDAELIAKKFDVSEEEFMNSVFNIVIEFINDGEVFKLKGIKNRYDVENFLHSKTAKKCAAASMLRLLNSLDERSITYARTICEYTQLEQGVMREQLHAHLVHNMKKYFEGHLVNLYCVKRDFNLDDLVKDSSIQTAALNTMAETLLANPRNTDEILEVGKAMGLSEDQRKSGCPKAIGLGLSQFPTKFDKIRTLGTKLQIADDNIRRYREHCSAEFLQIVDLFNIETIQDYQEFYYKSNNSSFISEILLSKTPLSIEKKDLPLLEKLHLSIYEGQYVLHRGADLSAIIKNRDYNALLRVLQQENPGRPGGQTDWHDEVNIAGPFKAGMTVFGEGDIEKGYHRMHAYIDREGLNHHDALFAFHKIIDLQKASGLSPNQFYNNILMQVKMDDAQYSSGNAHHELNAIAQSLKLDLDELKQKAQEFSHIQMLQGLMEYLGDPRNIFSSWKNLKDFNDLSILLEKRKGLQKLKQYREAGKDTLCDFAETLAFHRDSQVSIRHVMLFVEDPLEFLGLSDDHTDEALQSSKKPSNYVHIPHLDLTAEEVRDALVEGGIDTLQAFRPLEIRYTIPKDPHYPKTTREKLSLALGSRDKQKDGMARSVRKTWHKAKNILKAHGTDVVQYIQGASVPPEAEAQLEQLVHDKEIGMPQPDTMNLVVKIHLKSSTDGILAGNDTACCMPFGSGKNNIYMFNPSTSMFTIQIENGEGKLRTIAQSLMTRDKDIGANIADIVQKLQHSNVKMNKVIPEDVLAEGKSFAAADNVEVSPKYKEGAWQKHIENLYTDFFYEYMKRYAEQDNLESSFVPVGMGHSDALGDLPTQENTFAPEAPVGYSDKVGEEVLRLNTKAIFSGSQKEIAEHAKPTAPMKTSTEMEGVSHLQFGDTLAISYLEGKAYSDNESLMVHMHNLENSLIAKDISNITKNRPDMSLKYTDANGKIRGYLLAYEGKLSELGRDNEDISGIYIADLAADRSSLRAGNNLIKEFVHQYKKEYLEKGNLLPIYMEAREQTSYRIVERKLQQFSKELGIQLNIEKLPTYKNGSDTMHPVIIRPVQE